MADDRDLKLPYQPALDGLRALAVLAVVAYHLGYGWARGGFLGVDLFFVLSGYLITSLLLREWEHTGTVRLRSFWSRRARRLLPAILLLLAGVSAYAAADETGLLLDRLRWDGLATLGYFANWRFVVSGQSYFDLTGPPSPLRHMWSLAIEEQFYIVWPLVVFGLLRLARGSRLVVATACLAGITASALLLDALFEPGDPSRAYYGTDARAHSLLVGCLLAATATATATTATTRRGQPRHARAGPALQVAGAAAGLAVVGFWNRMDDVSPVFYRGGSLAYALLVAVVIVAAVQPDGPLRRLLSIAPLRWIGKISYGLYLWHWPVIVFLSPGRTDLDGVELDALRVGVSIALATLSFALVEHPIRAGALRGWAIRMAAPTAVALTAVALIAATTSAVKPPRSLVIAAPTTSEGGPWACEGPTEEEQDAVAAELARRGGPEPLEVDATTPVRLLMVGDSWACSLYPGMLEVGRQSGIEVRDASIMGCGVVSGEVVPINGSPPREFSSQCPRIVADHIRPHIQSDEPPTALVWSSIWEVTDLYVDGRQVPFGTSESDQLLLRRFEAFHERVAPSGATIVFLTSVPAPREHWWSSSDDQETRRRHLSGLFLQFAAEHPEDVRVIDMAVRVCPDGPPCPLEIDGIEPRFDGDHYSSEGSAWMAQWLLPRVVEVVTAPAAG